MDRLNKGLLAFASYNAGPGKIRSLRKEAERRGLNPNVWFNNVERVVAEKVGRETVTLRQQHLQVLRGVHADDGGVEGEGEGRGEGHRELTIARGTTIVVPWRAPAGKRTLSDTSSHVEARVRMAP